MLLPVPPPRELTPRGEAAPPVRRPLGTAARLLVGASLLCYGAALALPAYSECEPRPPGTRLHLRGFECLLSPALIDPAVLIVYPSWWANPLYFFGVWAAATGRRVRQAVAGACAALLCAGFGAFEAGSEGADCLREGFWLWCAAMVLLTAAGLTGFRHGRRAVDLMRGKV
jgi:hypothetical protein